MIESRPERLEVLRGYLGELRQAGAAPPLSARLAAALDRPNVALLEHVARLERGDW
jgi:hypothetical protein